MLCRKNLPPGTLAFYDNDTLKSLNLPKFSLLPESERRGLYIAIEGIDGSGKTTVSKILSERLSSCDENVIVVREPWTQEIKRLLSENPNINPVVEAYLFAADRLLLHANVVAQRLREKCIIISDRSYIASLVYQVVRGADENIVWSLNSFAIKPDLVFLLDVDPDTAWQRINNKAKKQLMHLEERRYLKSLRERYLELSESPNLPKIIIVDSSQPMDRVMEEIYRELTNVYKVCEGKGLR